MRKPVKVLLKLSIIDKFSNLQAYRLSIKNAQRQVRITITLHVNGLYYSCIS